MDTTGSAMTSSRPYLLRALEQWIVDNDMTPFVVVDAQAENVDVPREYVEAGKIVLNIAPTAVANLNIDNEYLSFSARFSGKSREIWVPIDAVMAIYSRENGQGMVFAEEPSTPSPDPDNSPTNKKPDRPELKLVK